MANVLLVDDHPDLSGVVSEILTLRGHVVETCETAECALERIEQTLPDAVIVDARLPGLSGLDLLRRIRGNPAQCDLPVIIYSADDSPREAARREGACAFLLKGSDEMFEHLDRLSEKLTR